MRKFLMAYALLGIFWSLIAGAQPANIYRVGDTLPDWELRLINSQGQVVQIKLSALNGKAVLLNFYAEWCGPCNNEAPQLEAKFWKAYKDYGLVVVGLGVKESEEAVKRFRTKHSLTYHTGQDPNASYLHAFGQSSIPTNVIIDGERKIHLIQVGYHEPLMLGKARQLLGLNGWHRRRF